MVNQSLISAGDVIDALGGTTAASRITGRKAAAVSNWRAKNRLPSATFLILSAELRRIGLEASAALWGIEATPAYPERAA